MGRVCAAANRRIARPAGPGGEGSMSCRARCGKAGYDAAEDAGIGAGPEATSLMDAR
ncbi:hypothetical protein GCM10027067_23460 [Pseudactinotalea suaedae]